MSKSVWIDIDNPPQVQYLLPFRRAFEAQGFDTVVTARDYGITLELLRERGIAHCAIGREAGSGRARKATAALWRAHALTKAFDRTDRPDLVVTASRAAALAGRRFGKPIFTLIDYEHVDLRVPRVTGSFIIHPEAISPDIFEAKGFAHDRLIAFAGLKESITFSDVDLQAVTPADFGSEMTGAPRLLFRPPAERAHYYDSESTELAMAILERLATRDDVQLVLSPRYEHQIEYLARFQWLQPPIVLRRAVPFVSLLFAVDAVMSSGGTMLREAAYLGIPAFSIFRSSIGAVDRYLETIGRLRIIEQPEELEHVVFERARRADSGSPPGQEIVEWLVSAMIQRS
jgi:hypothetical protein